MKVKRSLILSTILLLGIGFATVSTSLYLNGNVNISANIEDFDVRFTRSLLDSVDNTNTAISKDGKTIIFITKELQALNDKSVLDFEVTNNSSIYDAEVSIECTSGEKGEYYQITKDIAETIPAKTKETGKVEVQKIKMASETIEETFMCTLVATAKERTTKVEAKPIVNKNIVNTDETCYTKKEVGACVQGTEIKYMVNASTEKTFHVLHDDGENLILQDSSITVENKKWNYEADNSKGPIAALTAIEEATLDWNNVNTIQYKMGITNFNGTNAYTGCSEVEDVWNCTTNTYTLDVRRAKARLITAQEAVALGCSLADNSCPLWLTSMPISVWTMTAHSSHSNYGLSLSAYHRSLGYNLVTNTIGAKAVIEINKYI